MFCINKAAERSSAAFFFLSFISINSLALPVNDDSVIKKQSAPSPGSFFGKRNSCCRRSFFYGSNDKWVKLDFASRRPYADKHPLAAPDTAEVRQYMAIGVLKDEEIGLMSDIIEVVYGG